MILQVVEVTIFDENDKKKNIKGKISLSDGFSKVITMVPDKVYQQIVSKNWFIQLSLVDRKR